MKKTKYFSYKNGNLCKGCKQCVKGRKLVLFVTGICNKNCFYCPLSPKKKNKDVIYANERKVDSIKEMIQEAKYSGAIGAGITGGDPLLRLDRTIKTIKELKKEFGKRFHIHLYTSPENVSKLNLKKLYNSGLDEIRFHPNILINKEWDKIEFALDYDWNVGIEIPLIPLENYKKGTIQILEKFKNKVNFFNFNELEISDATISLYSKLGLKTKDKYSYAIKGSQELALELMEKYVDLNIHFCTAKLKDSVQMKNRFINTAKRNKYFFDSITKDGLFYRGAIYLSENTNKQVNQRELLKIYSKLPRFFKKLEENRIIVPVFLIKLLKNKIKKLRGKPCVLVEYPTSDKIIIELEWL